jgi:hypothetical protein
MAQQPGWPVPVVTSTTALIQVVRFDALRQIAPARTTTWNLDGSKGLNLVPWARTELAVNLPPYVEHNSAKVKDGAGDLSFLAKYRFAAANEKSGNYSLSGWVLTTVPTGSYKNGAHDVTVQPNLGGGKGWGKLDMQTTLGATLPLANTTYKTVGRPVLWNTVAQYHVATSGVGRYFWPELESNATFYNGGTNDGKKQEFVMPGLIVGKWKLHPEAKGARAGFVAGLGFQIATSKFHTYNHALVLTSRWCF